MKLRNETYAFTAFPQSHSNVCIPGIQKPF